MRWGPLAQVGWCSRPTSIRALTSILIPENSPKRLSGHRVLGDMKLKVSEYIHIAL